MSWDGVDRRQFSREDQIANLDMTWQDAWYSMRRELAAVERELTELLDPETGRFTLLERDIKSILKLSEQFKGAIRLLTMMGGLFALVVTSWDTLKSWFGK